MVFFWAYAKDLLYGILQGYVEHLIAIFFFQFFAQGGYFLLCGGMILWRKHHRVGFMSWLFDAVALGEEKIAIDLADGV